MCGYERKAMTARSCSSKYLHRSRDAASIATIRSRMRRGRHVRAGEDEGRDVSLKEICPTRPCWCFDWIAEPGCRARVRPPFAPRVRRIPGMQAYHCCGLACAGRERARARARDLARTTTSSSRSRCSPNCFFSRPHPLAFCGAGVLSALQACSAPAILEHRDRETEARHRRSGREVHISGKTE